MCAVRRLVFPDTELCVDGLPWFEENSPELWRLPKRLADVVRDEVWELARYPSGGRIRFSSDTTTLLVSLEYASIGKMQNMCPIGQMGVAVYVDERYWLPVWPEEPGRLEVTLFEGLSREKRQYTLYLPLYHEVQVVSIGVDREARVTEPAPFAVPKPAAFYGSSITQGGCASHAGMSYQAILGRMLNIDFVNLGFSGEGRGEPELAQAFAEIDASCFVVDFAQNCETVDEMRERYAPFLETIRAGHPKTPIVCITPIFATSELFIVESRKRLAGMREVVREAVSARTEAGDENISIVEGTALMSTGDAGSFVDGVHPNDLGFQRMAEGLAPVIRSVLRLDLSPIDRATLERQESSDGERL